MSHKALAAAVVSAAVEDLGAAHRKVRIWHELEEKGGLREFVRKEIDKQEARRQEWERKQDEKAAKAKKEGKHFKTSTFVPNYSKITLSHDEAKVAEFFEEDNSMRHLYYGLLDIDGTPAKIMEQKTYIDENKRRIEASMRGYVSLAQRKIKEEAM